MQIEKRYLRKIARIFGELSVTIRLFAEDGSCLLPENESQILPLDEPFVPGQTVNRNGWVIRRTDMQPSLLLALPDSAGGCADLLLMAEGLLVSVLGKGTSISSMNDVFRMALRQELTGEELTQRAAEHQIVQDMERCVMLFSLPGATAENRACGILNELLPMNETDVLIEMDRSTAALVRDMHGVDGLDELKQYAQAVQETLLEEAMQTAFVAIGESKHTLTQLGESYAEAKCALDLGLRFEGDESVFVYSRMLLDRFLSSLPREDCQYYHGLLFNRRTAKLFNEEMLQTIEMFFRKDLNLSDTARQLFIHRNTLVYRLDKVQRLTGLDLRRFDDAVTFKILFKLKRCAQDKNFKLI